MNKYPCIKCGLCCRKISEVVESLGVEFPYKWDETGRCEMLGVDNLCMTYDSRPMLCNVDELMLALGDERKEFYNVNIASCNKLLQDAGREERIDFIP